MRNLPDLRKDPFGLMDQFGHFPNATEPLEEIGPKLRRLTAVLCQHIPSTGEPPPDPVDLLFAAIDAVVSRQNGRGSNLADIVNKDLPDSALMRLLTGLCYLRAAITVSHEPKYDLDKAERHLLGQDWYFARIYTVDLMVFERAKSLVRATDREIPEHNLVKEFATVCAQLVTTCSLKTWLSKIPACARDGRVRLRREVWHGTLAMLS